MSLDRKLQRTLLQKLADQYPATVSVQGWEAELPGSAVNLAYLHEHGLCEAKFSQALSEKAPRAFSARATAKGMDFLADDGGLSAILGVVTIKLHDDTIKSLIESKILESDLPEPEKKRFLDQLRELPGEATKHLVLKLVDLGLEKAPTAIEVIGKVLMGP
ncbi:MULTISPECIES: hypothetical protein [Comamonas]|uniref:hypothetical protein n=1 Tax=Comamonas TaxID=283 RepID=UPI0006B9D0B1|nr:MULTISPECIES: hypothetical protein [Comamonas]